MGMRMTRLLSMALLVALAGCGFHLRGSGGAAASVAISTLHVSAPQAVHRAIESYLSGTDVRLVAEPADADVVLKIPGESFDRRVLAVDPVTGKESEFELGYTLRFTARRGATVLLDDQSISITRDFVFDRDALIGKSREQAVLETEMRRDAVDQLMRRLAAAVADR